MADHGFGEGRVFSMKTCPPEIIAEIVAKISKVPGVIWAHVVKPPEKNWWPRAHECCVDCDIIFEFDYPHEHKWNSLRELLDAIEEKGKANEHKFKITDVCIIQRSFQKGDEKEKK